MKMKKLLTRKATMHSQNKKQGFYRLTMTCLVVGIILFSNFIIKQFHLSIDFTEESVFSLSEQSASIVKGLDEEIELIILHKAGSDESTITRVLDTYKKASNFIKLTYIDPELHPGTISPYQKDGVPLNYGSVIVSKGEKFKVISPEEMYTFDQNVQKIETVQAESKITNAILFIQSEYDSVVYVTVGHQETQLPKELTQVLQTENYTIREMNLAQEFNPQPNDIVIMNSPKKDVTNHEKEVLLNYLDDGGNLFLLADLIDEKQPNLMEVLNSYGVQLKKAMTFEDNPKYTITSQNMYLLPKMLEHPIVSPLTVSKSAVLTVYAQPIEIMQVKKDTLQIDSLLATSDQSYAKTIETMKSTTSQEKQEKDLSGPFSIAVAITNMTDENNPNNNGQIVLFSSAYLLKDQLIEASNQSNIDVTMNAINWLSEREESISIRGKDVSSKLLTMNQSQQTMISLLAMGIIPIIVVIIGAVVNYRRLNK